MLPSQKEKSRACTYMRSVVVFGAFVLWTLCLCLDRQLSPFLLCYYICINKLRKTSIMGYRFIINKYILIYEVDNNHVFGCVLLLHSFQKIIGLHSKLGDPIEKQGKLMFSVWLKNAIPHLFSTGNENNKDKNAIPHFFFLLAEVKTLNNFSKLNKLLSHNRTTSVFRCVNLKLSSTS